MVALSVRLTLVSGALLAAFGCSGGTDQMSGKDQETPKKSIATPLPKPEGAGPQRIPMDFKAIGEDRKKRRDEYEKTGKMAPDTTSATTKPPAGGQ